MTDSVKMVDKIRALLDKSESLSATGDPTYMKEAKLCAERAAELMQKYAIEESRIHDERGTKIVIVDGRVDDVEDAPPARVINGWMQMLANVLGRAASGNVYRSHVEWILYTRGFGYTLRLIGTQEAVDSTRYLYMWLSKELLKNCREHLRQIGGRGAEGNAYLQGQIFGIQESLAVGQRRALEGDPGTAMVLVNKVKEAADAHLDSRSDLKHHSLRVAADNRSFSEGAAKGREIQIRPDSERLDAGKKELKA